MELKNFKLLDGQTKKVGAHISSGIFDIYIHDNVIYKKAKAELNQRNNLNHIKKYLPLGSRNDLSTKSI